MNEVFDALDDLFIMTDTDFRIISANKVAKEYLGLSTDCLETDSIARIFSINDKEQTDLLHRVLSEKVVRLENELRGKEGKALQVNTRVTTAYHDDRQILYFISRLKSAQ
jgi:PAS domain S-box-containing protein